MEKAWQAEHALPVQRLENNRYIIEFESESMYNFVINGGPWRHKGDALIVVPYDGLRRPSEVIIDVVNVWVRFYDVPAMLMKPAFSAVLARKVSPRVLDGGGPVRNKNFLRARVALLLDEPLKPMVEAKVKYSGLMSFEVGYENVPFFCFICGRMGHSKRECPEDEEDSDEEDTGDDAIAARKRKLGEWMSKSPLKRAALKQTPTPVPHLAVNRALNFSGEQLARIQAASSANNSGRRRWKEDGRALAIRNEGAERSPLKLPWGESNALSNSVKALAVEEPKISNQKSNARDRVSGLNSYVGSSEPSLSVEDMMDGRDKEVPVKGIHERIQGVKKAKAMLGVEKKGPSPIKDIGKLARKGIPKESITNTGRHMKGTNNLVIHDEQHTVMMEDGGAATSLGTQGLVGGKRDVEGTNKMVIHNNKIFKEKLGDLTGAQDEPS
ncbi:unnamed protein product [Urochloa humidicola]